MNRSPTLRHHIRGLRKKLTLRVALLRRLSDTGWGPCKKILQKAALSLLYSTAKHSTPVWCGSAHTRLIDSVLNNAMRIVL